ncbi:Acid shock protein [Firmicutes bacterium ASF500]|nr:Acid shock protein [Firmicutes bacterium ASF500]
MMPSIFGENLFDDFFGPDFDMFPALTGRSNPLYGKHAKNLMKTDVRETEGTYELDIDLPGFKKDEVNLTLEDGYLTISAAKGLDKDEKDKKGKYIRQERYAGTCSRSFYVGEGVEPTDVSAKFEDGILKVSLPKREQKQLPKSNLIAIE